MRLTRKEERECSAIKETPTTTCDPNREPKLDELADVMSSRLTPLCITRRDFPDASVVCLVCEDTTTLTVSPLELWAAVLLTVLEAKWYEES